MKNYIPVELYHYSPTIELDGHTFNSQYNWNFYIGTDPKDIILEKCDDDNGFYYYRIIGTVFNEITGKVQVKEKYIGTGYFTSSIWSQFFDGEIENGCVELDTEIC